jgi:hypothetical protein
MPVSKIRQYLDDLKIQADASKRREIDPSGALQIREPIFPKKLTGLEWKVKRAGLTAKRNGLSEQFEAAPSNIQLGQQIKGLDDQIAECTEHMRLAY